MRVENPQFKKEKGTNEFREEGSWLKLGTSEMTRLYMFQHLCLKERKRITGSEVNREDNWSEKNVTSFEIKQMKGISESHLRFCLQRHEVRH